MNVNCMTCNPRKSTRFSLMLTCNTTNCFPFWWLWWWKNVWEISTLINFACVFFFNTISIIIWYKVLFWYDYFFFFHIWFVFFFSNLLFNWFALWYRWRMCRSTRNIQSICENVTWSFKQFEYKSRHHIIYIRYLLVMQYERMCVCVCLCIVGYSFVCIYKFIVFSLTCSLALFSIILFLLLTFSFDFPSIFKLELILSSNLPILFNIFHTIQTAHLLFPLQKYDIVWNEWVSV